MHSFWQRMERVSLKITPAAITAFMVLLAAVPLPFAGLGRIMPAFTLINIYYWGVFLPGVLPYTFLFLLGLLQDTLTGNPLGISSFINIAFAVLLVMQRRVFGKTLFRTVWLGFITLSFLMVLLQWVVMSIYFGRPLPVGYHMLQWCVTCLFYPLIHLMLTRIYQQTYAR